MKLFLESFKLIVFFGSPQNDFSFYKKKMLQFIKPFW